MRPNLFTLICLGSLMASGSVSAQQAAPTPPIAPQNAPPEVVAPRQGGASGGASTGAIGSDKSTGGVIRPPDVDPGMTRTPPPDAAQSMPVIPPPGTPGSKSNVTPK
jgi:hypothetical protein